MTGYLESIHIGDRLSRRHEAPGPLLSWIDHQCQLIISLDNLTPDEIRGVQRGVFELGLTDVRSQLKTLKAQRDRRHALPESIQLLARYETHINRQLAKALEQLKRLQDDRLNQGDPSGSFGKN